MISQCVVCDADVTLSQDIQVSEVVTCSECKSVLVVDKIDGDKIILSKAPAVEEDWGQ